MIVVAGTSALALGCLMGLINRATISGDWFGFWVCTGCVALLAVGIVVEHLSALRGKP